MRGVGTYLITGATGGIGSAVADLLYDAGHSLILVGRSAERLKETALRLVSPTALAVEPTAHPTGEDRVSTLELDLSDPRRIEAALARADLPALDGVVHSAGVVELGTVAEAPPGTWVEQLLVNTAAPAELTRLLLPLLRVAHGHVVFVNSGSGLRARGGWAAYAASKHALRALADALREEEPDIRVTSVYPGRTASEMQRKVRDQEGGEYDPADYMSARTVATVIVNALTTPGDANVTDVSVRG
ncbi:SDR family oxidoreductase [Actinoallomurus rhizosphaericola]|uniref:SDR family oxidoreductase n=1 Tax=Actinoallomurus rhizosphaericola TaxID=2952536 RepID=UPI002093B954|nr:SDR family oxidoreductase [Actinoallomurus rhizosphaericola]MCO5997549.1 SDR family oxidoreductase [Actinoallomurus rhizosphaericola]